MKYGIYILAIFMAFSASLKSGYAMVSSFTVTQDTTRQVVVYFDREDTTVDLSYKNNNQYINVLDSLLGNKENIRYITAVNVITFVSPDGDSVYNTVLSARRNNSVREFLQQRYPAVDMKKIQLFSGGEDWSEFRKVVEEDSDFPEREEVMMLMDYHRNDIGKRKQLLRKLNKGMAYQYMLRNVLPQLRRSVIIQQVILHRQYRFIFCRSPCLRYRYLIDLFFLTFSHRLIRSMIRKRLFLF